MHKRLMNVCTAIAVSLLAAVSSAATEETTLQGEPARAATLKNESGPGFTAYGLQGAKEAVCSGDVC